MCYEIKRLKNNSIDRSKCETIIQNIPRLLKKPKEDDLDFWIEERLCKYGDKFIYFRKKEVDKNTDNFIKYFVVRELEPFEVCEEFFYKLKEQWEKEGCGYYVVL